MPDVKKIALVHLQPALCPDIVSCAIRPLLEFPRAVSSLPPFFPFFFFLSPHPPFFFSPIHFFFSRLLRNGESVI